MVTIGIYQLLSKSALYENICLENIKKLYYYADKYYDQQQYRAIIEVDVVSIPEDITLNSVFPPGPYVSGKLQVQEN